MAKIAEDFGKAESPVAIPFERGIRFTASTSLRRLPATTTSRNPLRAGHPVHGYFVAHARMTFTAFVAIPFERGIRFTGEARLALPYTHN